MCIVLLAFKFRPDFKLILAGNRDEFYDRPTAPAAFWEEAPRLLAGRDVRAGGTWLGITRDGRFGVMTNYRDPASIKQGAPSRGALVRDYLLGSETPLDYLSRIAVQAEQFHGFNLLVGDRERLLYYSNRLAARPRELEPGLYGLSNHLLETPWPKVTRAKKLLAPLIARADVPSRERLFRILGDRTPARDEDLPDTGIGIEWERILAPIFIASPRYGTRSSTVLTIDQEDRVLFLEKSYASSAGDPSPVAFEFLIEP